MFNRRQSLIAATVACLLVASGASVADPLYGFASAVNTFTAASAPSRVKPASSVSYTVTLTNDPASPDRAQRARIGIPQGFNVDATSVYATTTGVAGACDVSTWVADGKLIENSKIQLKSPGGAPTKLCPGATITVVFLATSAATEGGYAWATELLIDSATPPFTLSGSQPAVVVDGTPPQATVTEKPSNPSNVKSPSFAFTANEASTFECKLDTGAVEPCTSQKSYANLADGLHAFTVRATDTAGNVGASVSYGWTIDTIAPTATITGKPSNPSKVKSPSFAFTANEASTFECKLDAGAVEPCSSEKSYANLADGLHAFTVRATDTAGNIGTSVSYGWTIDTIAPTTTITQKPSGSSSTSSPSFAFAASETGTSFACRLDNGSYSSCASPKIYSDLSDGPHTFAVRAIDAAGNTGPDIAYGWTIEKRSPTAAVTLAPAALSNTRSAAFGFSADEPATFECKLDEQGFQPCSSPTGYQGLSDGPHVFAVRPRDAVGNIGAPASHTWVIDATAPETTISSAPKSGTATSATFAFSASEGGSFECRLDGAPFAVCGSPKSYSPLRPGDHRFEVRAVDAAGNADPTPALHAWKVDVAVAKVTSTALLSPTAGARVKRPPLLVWRRVAQAKYYNVQIYRGRVKVFTGWPTRTRLQLKTRWKLQGKVRKLTPGTYRWYVWPGYGSPATRRYGALLGQSTFVVTKR
jgi:hypothetical protein